MTTVPPAQPGSWHRTQRVLRLAMPSAGEMLLGMLVGLVNTYLVGHLGAASLTAVGLGVQVSMAAMVLFRPSVPGPRRSQPAWSAPKT